MTIFERYLSVWVFLCTATGVGLGQFFPGLFEAIGRMEIARVNVPVGILIWVMIIPMLVKIDFGALHQVKAHWRGIGVTLFVNWAVKPFSMAFLGWLFIRQLFAPYLPATELDSYIAGLIMLIGATNFFELAVAAAISLFGFESGAALATVVVCWSRYPSCCWSYASLTARAVGTIARKSRRKVRLR